MKLKLLLFLLLCSTAAFAQIQKEKGTLVLKSGETLSGTLTHYYDNPSEVIFYNQQGVKEVFPSKQISAIQLDNGDRYVAKEYTTGPGSSIFNDKNYKPNSGKTTLILQAVLESPGISLYRREDDAAQFFYLFKDNNLYRLENNEITETINSKTYKRKDNKYIGTLTSLMSDRMDIVSKLNKVGLNEKDLIKIVAEYNQDNIIYQRKANTHEPSEANWVLFAQYSQYGTVTGDNTKPNSYGQAIGVQYYFSKHSRHSLKASLNHSLYMMDEKYDQESLRAVGLGLRYELSFRRTERYNAYMMVHLVEFAQVSVAYRNDRPAEENIVLVPLLSPGLGIEVKPFPRTSAYIEVNNLLQIDQLPKSISVGLKYDFGKTSW